MEEKIHPGLFKILPLVQVYSEENIAGIGVLLIFFNCS